MKKIILGFGIILLLGCSNEVEREVEIRILDLESRIDNLSLKNDSLKKQLKLVKSRNPIVYSKDFDTLENPETFITRALKKDTSLIPAEGILGGKMYFTGTEILNERFIWAEYEDGHIQASAIFSYKMGNNHQPEFKLISELKE